MTWNRMIKPGPTSYPKCSHPSCRLDEAEGGRGKGPQGLCGQHSREASSKGSWHHNESGRQPPKAAAWVEKAGRLLVGLGELREGEQRGKLAS